MNAERPLPIIGDGYDDHPLVGAAVRSIWSFAPRAEHTISREQADAILAWWQRYSELSEREISAILDRFPTAKELIEHGNSGAGGPLREVDSDE